MQVDSDVRREEILAAAYSILVDEGLGGISFRAVASRMGGSPTLVTHYYRSRREMIDALMAFALGRWKAEIEALEMGIDDPLERLRILLDWILPTGKDGLREERARLSLLANQGGDEETAAMLKRWDRYGRSLVRRHLKPLVAAKDLDQAVEIMRLVVYGVIFSTVQNATAWPRRRQVEAVEIQLRLLGISKG